MELLSGPGLLICGFFISFFMVSLFMDARKRSRKALLSEPEQNLFSYHYSAMYTVPNGTANHDGVMITEKKITTFEQCEKLKKDISPDNAHKMTITSLSFLGMVKEDGMTEEADSNEKSTRCVQ